MLTPSLPLSISIPFCTSIVPPSETGSTRAPSTPALVNCFVKCFLKPSLIKLLLPIKSAALNPLFKAKNVGAKPNPTSATVKPVATAAL